MRHRLENRLYLYLIFTLPCHPVLSNKSAWAVYHHLVPVPELYFKVQQCMRMCQTTTVMVLFCAGFAYLMCYGTAVVLLTLAEQDNHLIPALVYH